jgi:plasmid maintenance system antidote protein VapI
MANLPDGWINEDQLRERLRALLQERGASKKLAHELHLSPGTICDMQQGDRSITARVATALGFELVKAYAPIEEKK